jgi:sugar/nucleoside kinase (ribokinase family)
VVGSASRDVTADDPRGWRLGGAATYAGLTLARLGLRPRVLLGVDAAAAVADELDLLRDAGAELQLVHLQTGPVFRNRATAAGRIQDCIEPGEPLPVAGPTSWFDGQTWVFVPVADELPPDWALAPRPDAFVALGWQGLLRNLSRGGVVTRRPPRAGPLVERAGLVCLSREDTDPATSIETLAALLRPPAMLAFTDGPAGGIIRTLDSDGSHHGRAYEAIPATATVDPTGAGDAFLASLVAARLGHPLAGPGYLDSELRFAAAVASLTVEAPGLHGVPGPVAIAERLRVATGD